MGKLLNGFVSVASAAVLLGTGALWLLGSSPTLQRGVINAGCSSLDAHPDGTLQASQATYFDKGIVFDYRQLASVTVTNTSNFCEVSDIDGEVTWQDAQGRLLGSTTFRLTGTITARGTKSFSMLPGGGLSSTTLQGAGKTPVIHFTHVSASPNGGERVASR